MSKTFYILISKSLLALILLGPTILLSQKASIRVQHINSDDGLSQVHVNTIYQDTRGYTWFGTKNGLNRFDGHEIIVYKNDPDKANTISDNFIRTIVEDNQQRLWIGTDASGLNVFDLNTETFKRISLLSGGDRQRQSKQVWDMSIDENNQLWIATWEGIYKINLETTTLQAIPISSQGDQVRSIHAKKDGSVWFGSEQNGLFEFDNPSVFHHQLNEKDEKLRVYTICEEDNHTLWLGTKGGLIKFNTETKTFKNIPLVVSREEIEITALTIDLQGTLWIGTIDNGLISLDTKTEEILVHLPVPEDRHGLSDSGFLDLYADDSGILWIATRGDGVQFFDTRAPFDYYGYQPDNSHYLSDPSVRSILTDEEGLWIGGYSGLDYFNQETGEHTHYANTSDGLINDNIYSLLKDSSGTLLVGTEGGGLFYQDQRSQKFRLIPFPKDADPTSNYIYELFLGNDATVYIGTGAGLYLLEPGRNYNKKLKKVKLSSSGIHGLDAEGIFAITQGNNGHLFVGTQSAGLFVLDQNHNQIAHYVRDVIDRSSISNDRIKSLHIDKKGFLWVGTGGGGLNKLDSEEMSFLHYNENDGLPDNTIYGILEDARGRLWLSTNKGLSIFDETDLSVKTFGIEHGLQSLEFNTGAFYKSASGKMYFGGINGLNAFFPEDVPIQPVRLPVIITEFKIANKKVKTGSQFLPLEINALNEIYISHKERIITFEFSAMNFLSPTQTRYRYMIPGIDENWVYTDHGERSATYTDLPAGSQELLVQASPTSTDYFGKTRRLMIYKKFAPWNSYWARGLLLILVVLFLYLVRQSEIKKIKLKGDLKKKKQEAQKLNEIDDMKSRLISNVSYELRTPLTLLAGQIENLGRIARDSLNARAQKNLKDAQTSIVQVKELSNQLFDLAAFASGKIKLQTRAENLSDVLSLIVNDYTDLCNEAGLELQFLGSGPDVQVYLDKPKFEQLLINLIKNAIKLSDKGSTIQIQLLDEQVKDDQGTGEFAVVSVSHQGPGIPKETLQNLFDRLYESDASDSGEKGGAGIGLALVKELVELHGGTISAKSEMEGETRFDFTIPKGRDHLAVDEILDVQEVETSVQNYNTINDPTRIKILVVEDEESMRSFLFEGLEDEYQVLVAEDGEEGLLLAINEKPDLIISDIHMPHKSGLDMLKEIRNNQTLMNVPVMLLTGQTSSDDRVVAFKASANDFISKPFELGELKARIENIITQRKQLINSLKNGGFQSTIPNVQIENTSDRFYLKLKGLIEANIDQSNLTVEFLSKEVFMGKRQLERKLKGLTGQSPAELIRQIRLLKAKHYLFEGSFTTVAEVSYAVGFKNVKYFSRVYKNQFNQSPADILRS